MFVKPQFRKAGRIGRQRPYLAAGGLFLLMLAALSPPLRAQTDFDTNSIFQGPAGPVSKAPAPAGPSPSPALPPSASDPFNLPPVGSIPLGSDVSPLTSPATSAVEFQDDPFGTPAPENRQVRQVGVTLEQPTPETPDLPEAPPEEPAYVPPEARQTLDEAQRARLRALFPDMLPPEEQTVSALTPPAVPDESAAPSAPEQPAPDGAAIGRAGSLLTKEYYGQAKILPPLELPLAQEDGDPPAAPALPPNAKEGTPQPAAGPAKAPAVSPAKAQPAAVSAQPQPAASPAKAQPAVKPAQTAAGPAQPAAAPAKPAANPQATPPAAKDSRAAVPPLPRGSLALVNETGDPKVGAVYQSALSRLGYTVLAGPAGGFRGGPTGQTVIYYRPGAQDKALAVSRDLPGRKTLAEAPAGTNNDIVVVLR